MLIIGFLTFIHEFGHFFFARLFKVPILEFAIGMGPKLFSWTGKTGTRYALRAFPIGGFVQMEGEEGTSDDPNAYNNLSPWKKIVVTVAGPVVNIIFAIIVCFVIVLTSSALISTTVGATADTSALQQYDEIVKVGNVAVYTGDDAYYEVMMQGYQAIDVTVIRNGEKIVLEDVVFPADTSGKFAQIDFICYSIKDAGIGDYLKHAFFKSVNNVKMVWDSLIGLISGRFGMNELSGPVGIVDSVNDVAQENKDNPDVVVSLLVNLLAVISMNLGIFNLLPIPALDGGRIFFHLIDGIAGKKVIKKEIEDAITSVTMILLLIFMFIVSAKDIINLF